MDALLPDDFDQRQLAGFLDKIARDCDAELRAIAERRDAEIARISAAAHAESRRLFRQGAQQLRARLALQESRQLARLRSELRRRHWAILAESQQRAFEAVNERFRAAWQDPQRQWEWCRFWLRAALERAGAEPLRIALGRGAARQLAAKIDAETAGRAGDVTVLFEPEAMPGIRIEWGDYVMDGGLDSQVEATADTVLERLSELLHGGDGTPAR